MPLLPLWLQQLFRKKKGTDGRAFGSEVDTLELVPTDTRSDEPEGNQASKKTASQEFEIFPEDPAIRKQWFSLTVRERQVIALVCMGYRN
jgi:hypothetical protein